MVTKVNFSCTYTFFFVPLQREPALGMSAHHRRRVADIIKGVYWRLFWHLEILQNFFTQSMVCLICCMLTTINISAWAFIVYSC